MRISDWSSDVCSSDLHGHAFAPFPQHSFFGVQGDPSRSETPRQIEPDGPGPVDVDPEHRVAGRPLIAADRDPFVEDVRRECRQLPAVVLQRCAQIGRSEEHTSELPSLMRISYAVFCLKKKKLSIKKRLK